MIVISEGRAIQLSGSNGKVQQKEVCELKSGQEETDTRVVLYASYGAKLGYEFIRVRSPDSDIFFILLHHVSNIESTILFDTGCGNKRRLLNVTEKAKDLGQHTCSALMALHVLTGCDTTSALKGIGKVKPIKLLQKEEKFEDCLCQLGEFWDIPEQYIDNVEQFICCLYGFPRFKSIDDVRVHILRRKCERNGILDPKKNIDLANLPPCLNSLTQHVKRVNYQVKIWKLANNNFQEKPSPTHHGWVKGEVGLEPLWSDKNILPTQLVDLVDRIDSPDTEDEENVFESDSSNNSDME